MTRLSRRGVLTVLAGGTASTAAIHCAGARTGQPPPVIGEKDVVIRASAFADFATGVPGRTQFGDLDFVGGLDISCDDRRFGGLSGLALSENGHKLLAVTDRGVWFSGTLDLIDGRPSGISDAILAPMLGPDGRALSKTRRYDTESLAVAGGVAYVGVEGVHEVLRFPIVQRGFAARGEPLSIAPEAKRLPRNRSFEAVAVVPAGAYAGSVLAVAERSSDGDKASTQGFFVTGPRGMFTVTRHDGFDVTDMTFLPSGDLLLLERRYGWLSGLAMRIRRIDGRDVRPGAQLDGPTLIGVGGECRIDNMECLAVHRDHSGVVLTIVSDDNFSILQRTLLLQFRMGRSAAA